MKTHSKACVNEHKCACDIWIECEDRHKNKPSKHFFVQFKNGYIYTSFYYNKNKNNVLASDT